MTALMIPEHGLCYFCGRAVLDADGVATLLESYHQVLAPWDPVNLYFYGSFHYSCVRSSKLSREVRSSLREWIHSPARTVTVTGGDGIQRTIPGNTMGFTELVAVLPSGEIFASPQFNSWAFLECAGPAHFLSDRDVQILVRDGQVRGSDGMGTTLLHQVPGPEIAGWSLDELLGFLGIADLYAGLREPRYTYYGGGRNRAGFPIDYSLSCVLPLPADVTAFFQRHLPSDAPKRVAGA